MDIPLRLLTETAAQVLLQAFQAAHPQWIDDRTPLDDLVSWLGLHIETFHPDDYPDGTYGFIDPDEDEHLIWLRRDLPEALRRFTLAHELGHAVLHCHSGQRLQSLLDTHVLTALTPIPSRQIPELSRQDPCHDTDVQLEMASPAETERFQEIFTLGAGEYDPRSQRELAANMFAAELLMPLERLRRRYVTEHIPFTTLSQSFAVSHAALLNRLMALLPPFSEQELSQSLPPQAHPSASSTSTSKSKPYDEFQEAAIAAPTPALVVAGPGSGKTSTLIGRIEYAIHTLNVAPQQILALTFSRKAALEMKDRLQQTLGSPLPQVSTFHAFCADLLRRYGRFVGLRKDFSLIDEAEGYFLLRQQAKKMRLRHYQKLQSPTYYFPDLLKAISRAKDELVSPATYMSLALAMQEDAHDEASREAAEKALEVAHVYTLYEQELQRRGDSDFGGLLLLAVRLLQEYPAIRNEQQALYQQILVDEFQDVNRASGVLLREVAGTARRVWVVGDANQAIYRFRGASPANIRQFEHDFPGAHVLFLSRNYRSRSDLVTFAETFRCTSLENEAQPEKNQPVRRSSSSPDVILASASDEACELAGLLEDLRHKRSIGYKYNEMAILCRTRSQVQHISRALASAGLPVKEHRGLLEQESIKDLLSLLLLLGDPSGMGLLRATRQPEHPLSQSDLEAVLLTAHEQQNSPRTLLVHGEVPPGCSLQGRQSLLRLSDILHRLQHTSDIWSLLAHYLFVETSRVRNLLMTSDEKQSRTLLTHYYELLQLARHYDQQQHLHATAQQDSLSQASLEERIQDFLEYLRLLVQLRQESGNRYNAEERNDEDDETLLVMTVHASKGLEFPVVYLPGLVQRRFPLQARSSPVSAPTGMLSPESSGKLAHDNGESCLFYVGVTRARDHLILSFSDRYGKVSYKRSSYLDSLEAGLPAERISKLRWEQPLAAITTTLSPSIAMSSQPSQQFIQAMRPPSLTAGAIEAYQRCPRQYAYRTIYGFTTTADPYQLFWQATQRTIETLHERIQGKGKNSPRHALLPTQQEIQRLYTQHWQELGGHDTLFGHMYEEHGHEVVEAVRRKLIELDQASWETRSTITVTFGGKPIHVTVDRIEVSHQQATAPRFVHARFGRRKEKPTAQLRDLFYTLAYREQYPEHNVEIHSHNLSTDELFPITLTTRKEQSLIEGVEQSIQGLERHAYPAEPAEPFRCPMCPFFLICPA